MPSRTLIFIEERTRELFYRNQKYWDNKVGLLEVELVPEASVRITLKASKAYPVNAIIELTNTGKAGFLSFYARNDSTFSYRLYGNGKNTVSWRLLINKDPNCNFLGCAKDVLATGALALNPQKFETLITAINY